MVFQINKNQVSIRTGPGDRTGSDTTLPAANLVPWFCTNVPGLPSAKRFGSKCSSSGCMYVFVYVHVYVHMYVYMYVYVYVYLYVYILFSNI